MKPVTAEEHIVARDILTAAGDNETLGEIRRRTAEAIKAIRESDCQWAVHAVSDDMPGRGYVVSTYPNKAAALTECIRLNQKYKSDFGSHAIHPVAPT